VANRAYLPIIDLFDYNEITGELLLKDESFAGYKTYGRERGYIQVSIKRKTYMSHRIAWACFYKEEPPKIIDHINGNGFDNSIKNLKRSSPRENQQNRKLNRLGKLYGCHYNKQNKGYIAKIKINGKSKHIGLYKTEIEAHNAYKKALKELDAEISEAVGAVR